MTLFAGEWQNVFERHALSVVWVAVCIIIKLGLLIKDKVPSLKVLSTKKLILARLGVSGPIYVNIDSPNLGFPYFNFLGGYELKNTLYITRL